MLLLACLRVGMTVSDIDDFEVGMLIDIITTHVNMSDEGHNPTDGIRQATQKDFDRF